MARIKPVKIGVHPIFFEQWFEPTRKKYEKKMKIQLSQIKFTEMMAKKFFLKSPITQKKISRRFKLHGL